MFSPLLIAAKFTNNEDEGLIQLETRASVHFGEYSNPGARNLAGHGIYYVVRHSKGSICTG